MLRGQGGFTGTVDNVSVKEVLGNHAIQTTSTKRPVLARHPEGGIRNLLDYTQEFDDWSKVATTVTANATTAPDGTATANKVIANTVFSQHRVDQSTTSTAGVQTLSAYVKNAGYGYVWMRIGGDGAAFNIADGSIFSPAAGVTAQSQDVGNGWRRVSISRTAVANEIARINMIPTTAITDFSGDGTSGIYIWGAQLEEGSTATQYQHVTDDLRYDITEPFGANSLNYLKFDGASDAMSLTGLTSPSTPITAWFGYSATNAEASPTRLLLDIETGRTFLGASVDVAGNIGYYDGDYRGFAADSNALKVLTYDLVEDNAKIRIDGTQEYSDTTYDQRAIGGQIGLFAIFPVDANFLAGNLYSCILRAAESTDKEIASTESYVAKKTGVLAQVDGLATLSLDFGGNTYTARNSNGGIL